MWRQIEHALRASMSRVLTKIATLLPGLGALLLALVLFALIGCAAGWAVTRILQALRFDDRLHKLGARGWSDWSHGRSPSQLAGRAVFWCLMLIGLLVGLSAFDAASAYALSPYLAAYVPRLFAAFVILVLGNVLARFLGRTVLISGTNMHLQYARLLSLGVKWLVLVLTAAMVLDHLAIGGTIVDLGFGILFGGIVFALALAVGLGSRDVVSRELAREMSHVNAAEEDQPASTLHHY